MLRTNTITLQVQILGGGSKGGEKEVERSLKRSKRLVLMEIKAQEMGGVAD